MFRLFTLLGACLVCASCSTTHKQEVAPDVTDMLAEVTGQNGRACIKTYEVNGFGGIEDNLVSVSGKFRDHYLVTTLYRCQSLQGSPAIAFAGSFQEICGGGHGALKTGKESCPVKDIYVFPNREAAFAAVAAAREQREQLSGTVKFKD
jgi:hypothetical protein